MRRSVHRLRSTSPLISVSRAGNSIARTRSSRHSTASGGGRFLLICTTTSHSVATADVHRNEPSGSEPSICRSQTPTVGDTTAAAFVEERLLILPFRIVGQVPA